MNVGKAKQIQLNFLLLVHLLQSKTMSMRSTPQAPRCASALRPASSYKSGIAAGTTQSCQLQPHLFVLKSDTSAARPSMSYALLVPRDLTWHPSVLSCVLLVGFRVPSIAASYDFRICINGTSRFFESFRILALNVTHVDVGNQGRLLQLLHQRGYDTRHAGLHRWPRRARRVGSADCRARKNTEAPQGLAGMKVTRPPWPPASIFFDISFTACTDAHVAPQQIVQV